MHVKPRTEIFRTVCVSDTLVTAGCSLMPVADVLIRLSLK